MSLIDKEAPSGKGVRTALQGYVVLGVMAIIGVLLSALADTTWHPAWLAPFVPGVAGILAWYQNKLGR